MSYIIQADYKTMYYTLWRNVAAAVGQIEDGNYLAAKDVLVKAQQKCEDIFIDTYTEIKVDDGKDICL